MLLVLVFSASLQPCSHSPRVALLKARPPIQRLTGSTHASRATAAAGSFTADGQGNITSGEMDFTSAAETFPALPITGTYTLNGAGGTLNLTS
jgi:hypothetical protein